MATKKLRAVKARGSIKKRKCKTVFDEVETLEDVAPRMIELLPSESEGNRIYISIRDRRTIN
jgi:hypothetical protein